VSFGLGFVLLGSLRIGQHYQFHYVRRTDRALLWLHLALLLASGGCLLGSWTYATRGHRLVASSLPAAAIDALRARIMVGLIGYGVGFGLAFVLPVASIAVCAVMPLLYLVPSRAPRRGATRLARPLGESWQRIRRCDKQVGLR
jgi:uncharacterized membrane protein